MSRRIILDESNVFSATDVNESINGGQTDKQPPASSTDKKRPWVLTGLAVLVILAVLKD